MPPTALYLFSHFRMGEKRNAELVFKRSHYTACIGEARLLPQPAFKGQSSVLDF